MKTYFKNVFNCLFIIILFSSLALSGCSDGSGGGGSSKSSDESEGTETMWYADSDEDGFGDPAVSMEAVSKPDGYVDDNTDCNDENASINPGAEEIPDGEDNDCDGNTDDLWFADNDKDGFGDPDDSLKEISQPDGYVDNNFDCNDNNADIHPQAKEDPSDDTDHNCNGAADDEAQDGNLPDTGQTTPQTEIFGDDADYLINPHSYTKLGENGEVLSEDAESWIMVKDNVTGLIWEVKNSQDNNQSNSNPHDADNTYSWPDANDAFIDALNTENFGNLSDEYEWRLPTLSELLYLSDYSTATPAINNEFFPTAQNEILWSSTQNAKTENYAWSFFTNYGGYSQKGMTGTFKVRAVWGKKMPSAFEDNKFGTVKDTTTGLMWQQATATTDYGDKVSWNNAIEYCEDLKLAGYDDWRLPNKNELISLIDFQKNSPAINSDTFPDTKSSHYWTSTTSISNDTYAFKIDFESGDLSSTTKNSEISVRAVRGGNHRSEREWYLDNDKDGYGSQNPLFIETRYTNERQPENFVANNDDCDDNAESTHPSAAEIADDGTDQDCNGHDLVTWYRDEDEDSFGDENTTIKADTNPDEDKYIHIQSDIDAGNFDCDDSNNAIYPGTDDLLDDGLDNDCDGKENITWYIDGDGDGYGSVTVKTTGEDKPEGAVANSQDCNDDKPLIRPGLVEVYGDEEDSNCNGDNNDTAQQIIPDTGQITSYTNVLGEDSDFLINKPYYIKLADDGTELGASSDSWAAVKDNITELIWEVKTEDNKDALYSFEQANEYCDNLVLATYEDWRLPTPLEMSYIVDHDRTGPALDTDFFINTNPANYWTFSPDSVNPDIGLIAEFNYGVSYIKNSLSNGVMAVRGQIKSASNYIDNNDGTIFDTNTGLMWQKETIHNENGLTWAEALNYCNDTLKLASYTDWRLPNKNELLSLLDESKSSPAIDSSAFPDTQSIYWSSTSCADPTKPGYGWQVNFSDSGPRVVFGKYNNSVSVRAVRGGKIETP